MDDDTTDCIDLIFSYHFFSNEVQTPVHIYGDPDPIEIEIISSLFFQKEKVGKFWTVYKAGRGKLSYLPQGSPQPVPCRDSVRWASPRDYSSL